MSEASKTPTASFTTTLSVSGNNTGIEVPEATVTALGSNARCGLQTRAPQHHVELSIA